MKKARKIISVILVIGILLSAFSFQSFAWKNMTHVNSADIILLELQRSAKADPDGRASITIYAPYDDHVNGGKTYQIPYEFQDALFSYPEAFRAGAMGPDFYPDIITGQLYIHPYDSEKDVGSGEWIKLLCDSVNQLPANSEARKEALSFTLGYMLHYCGDLFGHDFVNAFSGGTYPDISGINWDEVEGDDPALNILFSHMAEESYMDKLVNYDFYSQNDYLASTAPVRFVADSMVFNGNINGGAADIYGKYGELPIQYKYLVSLRASIYRVAEDCRDDTALFAVSAYLDKWIADLDRAVYALVEVFDTVASKLVVKKDTSASAVITEELMKWFDEYGRYALPTPDLLTDAFMLPMDMVSFVLESILADEYVAAFNEWKASVIKDACMWAGDLSFNTENNGDLELRLEDPEKQLDDKDNPFDPTGDKTNFEEFKEYMDRYAGEQSLLDTVEGTDSLINGTDNGVLDSLMDSQLESFYNTMVMFKLVLMGPDNFSDFIKELSGKSQSVYEKNTAYLAASSIRLEITTADAQNAGTDDNLFAVVYELDENGEKTFVTRKLLDLSLYNDFESGDKDEYIVELPGSIRVDKLEISIEQESASGSMLSGWNCENINIIPMHAGIDLIPSVSVGGNAMMNTGKKWDLRFQDAIKAQGSSDVQSAVITNLKLDIETSSVDNSGTDGNVYLLAYNTDYSTEKPWVKVLLDKDNYNDFESGDKDTYEVSLCRYVSETELKGIALDKLLLAIDMEDNNTAKIGWNVANLVVTPYYGNMQLAEPIDFGGYVNLRPDDDNQHPWWLDIQSKIEDSYIENNVNIEFSYITSLDADIISFVDSLDDSAQWVNDENILWSDADIRETVFLEIFKGFTPDAEYTGTTAIEISHNIEEISVDFTGMWNGLKADRRNAVGNAEKMPEVAGLADIEIINSNGETVATFSDVFIDGEKAVAAVDYENRLEEGSYDVRVNYYDTSGYYRDGEIYIENAFEIYIPEIHICNPHVVPEIPAECEKDGKKAYYQCACGNAYEDADCEIGISDIISWGITEATGHKDDNADYACDNGCGYEYEKPVEPDTPEIPDVPEEPSEPEIPEEPEIPDTPEEPSEPEIPEEPADNSCEFCGKEHNDFFSEFICFFIRIISILKNLFA